MNSGQTVLRQILNFIHHEVIQRANDAHPMRRNPTALSHYDHFVVLVFAQIAQRDSLRSIVTCCQSLKRVLYHSGIRGNVTRCNLAYANIHRSSAFFEEIAKHLIKRAKQLYSDTQSSLDLDGQLLAIDSTVIDLGFALFPWARWQETQAAVKLNVLFSVEEELPELCSIVTANEHDVNFLKTLTFAAGHYYVFDRGYPDFASWFRINQSGAGLFQPMIGFIETGTCVPTVATLFRIASVLGCPLAEIFGTVEAAIASGRRIPALGKRAKRR